MKPERLFLVVSSLFLVSLAASASYGLINHYGLPRYPVAIVVGAITARTIYFANRFFPSTPPPA